MDLIQERLAIAIYNGIDWEHQFYGIFEENLYNKSIMNSQGKDTQNLAYGKGIHDGSVESKDHLKRPKTVAMMLEWKKPVGGKIRGLGYQV